MRRCGRGAVLRCGRVLAAMAAAEPGMQIGSLTCPPCPPCPRLVHLPDLCCAGTAAATSLTRSWERWCWMWCCSPATCSTCPAARVRRSLLLTARHRCRWTDVVLWTGAPRLADSWPPPLTTHAPLLHPRPAVHQAESLPDSHSLHITLSANQQRSWAGALGRRRSDSRLHPHAALCRAVAPAMPSGCVNPVPLPHPALAPAAVFLEEALPAALRDAAQQNRDLRRSLPRDMFEFMGLMHAREDGAPLAHASHRLGRARGLGGVGQGDSPATHPLHSRPSRSSHPPHPVCTRRRRGGGRAARRI